MIAESLAKFIDILTKNTNYIFLSLVFGLLGTGLNPRNRTLWSYIISLFSALCIGVLCGYYLEDMGMQERNIMIVVALVSIVAKDSIEFFLNFMGHLNDKTKDIVDALIKKVLDKF